MKTKTKEFSLNFGGFYHSQHSENIDSKIESYGYDWEEIDYKKTYINYSKAYLNKLSNELDINISFISLDSPIEYNFITDNIFCNISNKDFKSLLDTYDTKELFNYIEQRSKSRSGFTSFYSGYKAVKEDEEIFLQYLFNYILQYEQIEFYDLEFQIEYRQLLLD